MTRRILFYVLFLTAIGCATPPAPVPEPAERTPAAAAFSSPDTAYNYYMMMAEIAVDDGRFEDATDAYLQAIELTEDPGVAERAARVALHAGQSADAWEAARRWRELEPGATGPAEIEAIVAMRRGDRAAARVRVDELLRVWGAPDRDAYRSLARLFYDEFDTAKIVALFLDVARDTGDSPAWEIAGMLALRADDFETAGMAAERARSLDPASAHAAVLAARVLVATGQAGKGLALMRATVAENPDDPTLRFTLAGLYLDVGQLTDAVNELEQVVAEVPSYMDARWTLGLLLLQQGETDAAEPHLRALLADPTRRMNVPYYLGGVHELKDDHATAREWFDQVESGDHLLDARIKAAHMSFLLGEQDDGLARLERARAAFPDQVARLYRAEAQLLEEAGRVADAIAVYDDAVREMPDEAGLLYSRALLRERSGDHIAAIADLRRVYTMRPESAEAQNALGYLLADRGPPESLDEAHRLISSAVGLEPENPAIIDSMGWVLYRKGDLESAREWLQRAWSYGPDPEVGAHLGEVLWKLGERDAAREVWAAAAELDADHRVLNETLERLGVEQP